jgi:hypothetical protein
LQQHLCDAGAAAEVAVDLERRVQVEKVAGRAFLEQQLQMLVRLVPVLEAGVEVDDPCPAPAGVPAAAAEPVLERPARRARELRASRGA